MFNRIRNIPLLDRLVGKLCSVLPGRSGHPFPGSEAYWEDRYASGGDSGAGSYEHLAAFKAKVLNAFVAEHDIKTVIEFGCGDGNQLSLSRYPNYLGFDVSPTVIAACRRQFSSDSDKSFRLVSEYAGETGDLVLSLDVIFHLVEDDVFERYMETLFAAATRYVIIYSSDTDDNRGYEGTHVRHRIFTRWIHTRQPGWRRIAHIPNPYPYTGDHRTGSFADFHVYEMSGREAG